MNESTKLETATLGGGCFWCLDAVYRRLEGVAAVESGYAGGHQPGPTYREVCAGATGHAEVVQVHFDAAVIDYRNILEVFFTIHNPTTLNRQGADIGTQYRSAILTHSPDQRAVAEELIDELERDAVFPDPIVTEVAELETFHPGEDHHQDYYDRNAEQPYCQAVIAPKLAKLRDKWSRRLRPAAEAL